MRRFTSIVSLGVILSLSACATYSNSDKEAPSTSLGVGKRTLSIPDVALSPEIVYGVLASEIAVQRGAPLAAAQTYFDLAKTTKDPRMAQRATELAVKIGQINLAFDAANLWLKLDPKSKEAQVEVLSNSIKLGKVANQMPLIQTVIAQDPSLIPAIFSSLGILFKRQANPSLVAQMINDLAMLYPKSAEAQFAQLSVAAAQNDEVRALDALQKIKKIDDKAEFPINWYVDQLNKVSAQKAITLLMTDLQQRTNPSIQLQMKVATLMIAQKQYAQTISYVQPIFAVNQDPSTALILGTAAYYSKNIAVLEQSANRLNELKSPIASSLNVLLGKLYKESAQYANAKIWFEKVAKGTKEYPYAQASLVWLSNNFNVAKALNSIEGINATVLESNVDTLVAMLEFAKDNDRKDLALQLLNKLITKKSDPVFLHARGLMLDEMGRYKEAEKDLRAYLKSKPEDANGMNTLGYHLTNRTKNYQEALKLIEKANALSPDNAAIIDSLGWVYFKLGRYVEAKKTLEMALNLAFEVDIAAHLAEVLWVQGDKVSAQALLQRALAIEPKNAVVLEVINRLKVKL